MHAQHGIGRHANVGILADVLDLHMGARYLRRRSMGLFARDGAGMTADALFKIDEHSIRHDLSLPRKSSRL